MPQMYIKKEELALLNEAVDFRVKALEQEVKEMEKAQGMRTYKVFLNPHPDDLKDPQGTALTLFIRADDCNLETFGESESFVAQYNFTVTPEDTDSYSVGLVPFDCVRCITVSQNN